MKKGVSCVANALRFKPDLLFSFFEPLVHVEESSSPNHVGELVGELCHRTDISETDTNEMVNHHCDDWAENQDTEASKKFFGFHFSSFEKFCKRADPHNSEKPLFRLKDDFSTIDILV